MREVTGGPPSLRVASSHPVTGRVGTSAYGARARRRKPGGRIARRESLAKGWWVRQMPGYAARRPAPRAGIAGVVGAAGRRSRLAPPIVGPCPASRGVGETGIGPLGRRLHRAAAQQYEWARIRVDSVVRDLRQVVFEFPVDVGTTFRYPSATRASSAVQRLCARPRTA